MDDAVKQTIQNAVARIKDKIEEDYERRVATAEEFKDWLDRTKLLSGGVLTPMDLCESIAIQKKIQNIMALNLPRFLGNYNCKRYFQRFEGSEQEFIEQHPELKGSSGHKGVDVQKFSQDLRLLLSTKGNDFAKAFDAILSYNGVGIAIASCYLYLLKPNLFPLVNSAAKAGLQYYIGNQNRNTINAFSQQERENQGVDIPVNRRLQSYFGWSYLIKEFITIEGLEDFHKVDSILWLTNLQHKTSRQEKSTVATKIAEGVQYWRIVLPLDTHDYVIWPQCKELGLIVIGYTGDRESIFYVDYMRDRMKIGDKVVAYLGRKRIGGIGTITGEYEDYDKEKPEDKNFFDDKFWRRRKVKWDHLPKKGNFWTLAWTPSAVRHTIYKLSEEEYSKTLSDIGMTKAIPVKTQPRVFKGFTQKTFELLKQLAKDTSYDVVMKIKDQIHEHVVYPLRDLFQDIAQNFDTRDILDLEKEKRIMAHLWKANPRLGAWSYVWGAFYQNSESRITSMQFFIWLNKDHLTYGIYPSFKNPVVKKRIINNLKKYSDQLQEYLSPNFFNDFTFYTDYSDDKSREFHEAKSCDDLINFYEKLGLNTGVVLKPEEIIAKGKDLVKEISEKFEDLIPLYIFGISDDPIPLLESYYGTSELEEASDILTVHEDFTLAQCAYDTGFDVITLEKWIRAIERKGQVIFYGPPGTGKTFVAEKLAKHLVSNGDGFVDFVQFHPAFTYEDFMQGIRPKATSDGNLDYPVVPGRFLEFVKKSRACKDCCVLIIDEINRTNLARVFGELMYLLEYRDRKMNLAGGGHLQIPSNVRIIGTMNTADRSIALVDHALRRRFAFLALYPQYEVLRKYHAGTDFPVENLIDILEQLNKTIDDKHYSVGITFFLRKDLIDQIEDIWQMEIEPYIEEYFFDQPDKVDQFRWDKIKDEILE